MGWIWILDLNQTSLPDYFKAAKSKQTLNLSYNVTHSALVWVSVSTIINLTYPCYLLKLWNCFGFIRSKQAVFYYELNSCLSFFKLKLFFRYIWKFCVYIYNIGIICSKYKIDGRGEYFTHWIMNIFYQMKQVSWFIFGWKISAVFCFTLSQFHQTHVLVLCS